MKKIICALLAATMLVGLCACGAKEQGTNETKAKAGAGSTTEVSEASETTKAADDDDEIPEGYLSHDEFADILNNTPPEEWCSGWTTTAENDYWHVECKPMYVKKIGSMMGLKFMESVVVFKITNVSGSTYNCSGTCKSTDTESRPISTGFGVDIAPGETVYRCITISANDVDDGVGVRYVFNTARIVIDTMDPETFEDPTKNHSSRLAFDVDFSKLEKVEF